MNIRLIFAVALMLFAFNANAARCTGFPAGTVYTYPGQHLVHEFKISGLPHGYYPIRETKSGNYRPVTGWQLLPSVNSGAGVLAIGPGGTLTHTTYTQSFIVSGRHHTSTFSVFDTAGRLLCSGSIRVEVL